MRRGEKRRERRIPRTNLPFLHPIASLKNEECWICNVAGSHENKTLPQEKGSIRCFRLYPERGRAGIGAEECRSILRYVSVRMCVGWIENVRRSNSQ